MAESRDDVRKDAASKAIKKHLSKLSKALILEEVAMALIEEDFITEATFYEFVAQSQNAAPSQTSKPKFGGAQLVKEVQDTLRRKPHLLVSFCRILERNSYGELASSIQETYQGLMKSVSHIPLSCQKSTDASLSKAFQQLEKDLAFYNRQLSKEIGNRDSIFELIKNIIQDAIENALTTGESLDSVRAQMNSLCYDTVSVPTRLGTWAMQEVNNVYERLSSYNDDVASPLLSPESKELFTMDTLYHASVCCLAVNKCSTSNFKDLLNVSGHCLQEASISVTKESSTDRCLIAFQGSIMYVAFQSEPMLSDWLQSSYASFEEGFTQQMSRFPLRFFVEQLGEQKQIVFTGYSFGGMLACYVAANLWKENCVTLDVLQKNVICITFAQPLIALPFVSDATDRFSDEFKSSVHAYFSQEDPLPFIMHYFCGSQDDNHDRVLRAPLSTMEFKDPFSCQFLHNLVTVMQEKTYSTAAASPSKSVEQAFGDLKRHLSMIKGGEDLKLNLPLAEMVSLEGSDLNQLWRESEVLTDSLESIKLKKHNIEDYHKKVKIHLSSGKESLPVPSPKKELKSITLLKPQVKGVELHKFPSEHAIVVEGDNLWFCHEIVLGEGRNILSITNPAHLVSRRVIQFNYSPTEKTHQVIARNGIVKVTLKSHFANSIRKKVKVEQKPHEFSLRQMQLARYTPTEVICLAYWSAVLEQHTSTDLARSQFQQSQRLKKVREFLEEAVKVVPLESILNTIAFAENNTAIKCAEALIKSKVAIPPSVEALNGMQLGAVRLRTGLPGLEIIGVRDHALKIISQTSRARVNDLRVLSVSASSSNEIKFTMSSTPFVQNRQFVYPVITATTNFQVASPSIVRNDKLADKLSAYLERMLQSKAIIADYLCNMNIECIYPMKSTNTRHSLYSTTLQSPLDVLHSARVQIAQCLEELHDELDASPEDNKPSNEKMLDVLKEINDNSLRVCAALLGSFMEQKVHIPLIKSEMDTANILAQKTSPVAMGAWVLFSLGYPELHAKLSSLRGHPLIVEIADYIYGVLSNNLKPSTKTSGYDAKLQFLLQGITRIASCSSQYISYSLERQLCSNLKFDKFISVKDLVAKWDRIFKGDALSLVAKNYRSLIARWLKWAVLIHDLREALAEYSCIGVVGLMNSGKSQLVSKLFGIQTVVGTTKRRRTTIPLLYNLDGKVDGLDVIDFPGVDDKEFSVPKLAALLLGLLHVVIFVVHHDRATSAASLNWLKFLRNKDIPVIICMTHGDVLYFEEEDRRKNEKSCKEKNEIMEEVRREIGAEIYEKQKELRELTSSDLESINLYYFHLPSIYSNRVVDLKDAGICDIKDVGDELTKVLKQFSPDLSQRLAGFVHKGDQFVLLPQVEKTYGHHPISKYASILEKIPFIDPLVVLKCDSSGGNYTDDSHDISVTIPKNAIPEGQVVHFEIAITLQGPFVFANGKRPISPILWICTQENVKFKKLIDVKLPHFLHGLSESETQRYGVNFAKATHSKRATKIESFEFTPCRTKQEFINEEEGSYGALKIDHCCFMCIEAEHTRELALRAGYCLSRVEYRLSPSRYAIHFCATFMLKSCLGAVKQQYSDKNTSITYSDFKFEATPNPGDSDAEPVLKLIRPTNPDGCNIALEPKKGQIRASTIDFWTKGYDIEALKLKHTHLLYPPRVKMTVVLRTSDLILPISFHGCTKDSDVDVELSITGVPAQIYTSSSVELELATKAQTRSTELGSADQYTVTRYLDPMNEKDIIRLGTALGLNYSNLKKMDTLPDDMVNAWLLKQDNVSTIGTPSWSVLVEALKKLDQNGIAQKIEKEQFEQK